MTYIAINVFSVMKPYRSVSLIARLTDRISAVYQKVLFKVPDVVKELHKLIFSNRCVWVIAAMFVVSAYVCASGQYHYTDDNKHMDEEYVLHGGADYTYFQDYLEELQKKYAGTLIGDYICFFMEKNRNTVEDKALYYGLQALLETRHSS